MLRSKPLTPHRRCFTSKLSNFEGVRSTTLRHLSITRDAVLSEMRQVPMSWSLCQEEQPHLNKNSARVREKLHIVVSLPVKGLRKLATLYSATPAQPAAGCRRVSGRASSFESCQGVVILNVVTRSSGRVAALSPWHS